MRTETAFPTIKLGAPGQEGDSPSGDAAMQTTKKKASKRLKKKQKVARNQGGLEQMMQQGWRTHVAAPGFAWSFPLRGVLSIVTNTYVSN